MTANYLVSLVNDMLDMSSLQSENLTLDLKPIDLKLVIDTVNSITEHAMADKGIAYSSNCALTWPCVLGDEVRIQRGPHHRRSLGQRTRNEP